MLAFSQWDNIKKWRKKYIEGDNTPSTDNETIANPEKQKEQRDSLNIQHQEKYTKLANSILTYHTSLNPSYTTKELCPNHPDLAGITPMLLDGMYDNIADITSSDSLFTEKWKARREAFNTYVDQKKNDILAMFTPDFLKGTGLFGPKDFNEKGLTFS